MYTNFQNSLYQEILGEKFPRKWPSMYKDTMIGDFDISRLAKSPAVLIFVYMKYTLEDLKAVSDLNNIISVSYTHLTLPTIYTV